MTSISHNLRKAAILIRSLDADAAAALLAQLSAAEARDVRLAIQSLGSVDEDERADVSAEFRRVAPLATEEAGRGVELELSTTASTKSLDVGSSATATGGRPFEFLEHARVESLVPYLAREHAQTVAIVLSYLPPARAAQVLAALPEKLQVNTLDRLLMLGDTDPDSLEILERELADWVRRQQATRTRPAQRADAVAAILAAAEPSARPGLLANLTKHNRQLAQQIVPVEPELRREPAAVSIPTPLPQSPKPIAPRLPRLHIDDLAHLDKAALGALLRTADAQVLVLALVGASEALVKRITDEMPPKTAKAFRQKLNCLGPTRLRDVEAAQLEVTDVASEILHARRPHFAAAR